jgi:hypothetical protein
MTSSGTSGFVVVDALGEQLRAAVAGDRDGVNDSNSSDDVHARRAAVYERFLAREAHYRRLFAQGNAAAQVESATVNGETVKGDVSATDDQHLMLVPVYQYFDSFTRAATSAVDAAQPRMFQRRSGDDECVVPPVAVGDSTIVSEATFKSNFDLFTEGALRYLDWSNVFVAGGSVLACLMPLDAKRTESNAAKRKYYHTDGYKSSDIDIFLYGLSEAEAEAKVRHIYDAICEALYVDVVVFRTKHALSIVSEWPYRHIQVICRLYKSPAEVLIGFDVDCVGVGYDGKDVLCLPRAHRALTQRANRVDMTRRSPSYEMRLAKYARRGFDVIVPGLQRARVDPQIFEKPFDKLQGLARLLQLEQLATPEARLRFKQRQRVLKLRPPLGETTSFWQGLGGDSFRDPFLRDRLEQLGGGVNASDYSCVFLPWGPKWTANRIVKLMYTKDMILNSTWFDPNKKIHTVGSECSCDVLSWCSFNAHTKPTIIMQLRFYSTPALWARWMT